jgi:RNA polymerase sigma-70 factor (ECF subfamily)
MEKKPIVLTDRSTTGDDASADAALMVRIVARDAAAFRLIADRHALTLRRIAYRMLGDAAEAEDTAQEALLRLWQHAARWRANGSGIGAWLNRVVINLCLDRLRRRRFNSDEAVPDRADEAANADALIVEEQGRAAVVKCIEALSERQRAAIVLTYYEGLSNVMAADALDMNIKAFESLLHRARHTLRGLLIHAGVVDDGEARLA